MKDSGTMKTQAPSPRPAIGQQMTVRGIVCQITCVLPAGTVEVTSLCGNYAFRVSGLSFV